MRRLLTLLIAIAARADAQTAVSHHAAVDVSVAGVAMTAHGLRFAGGTRFLSHPSRAGAAVAHILFGTTGAHGMLRWSATLHGGEAVDGRAARDHPGDARAARARFVHTLRAGVRLAPRLWLDAGVHPTHAGLEEPHPRSNLFYTHSLLHEFAPQRHAGATLVWNPAPWMATEARAVSGWEFAGQPLAARGVGFRLDLRPGPVLLRGYNLFTSDPGTPRRRLWGFAARGSAAPLTAEVRIELGSQENSSPFGRAAHWWGYLIAAHHELSHRVSVSGRFERYDDDKQIVLRTGAQAGVPNAAFRGYSETLGVRVALTPALSWRSEARAFQNSGVAFGNGGATRSASAAFALTALSASF